MPNFQERLDALEERVAKLSSGALPVAQPDKLERDDVSRLDAKIEGLEEMRRQSGERIDKIEAKVRTTVGNRIIDRLEKDSQVETLDGFVRTRLVKRIEALEEIGSSQGRINLVAQGERIDGIERALVGFVPKEGDDVGAKVRDRLDHLDELIADDRDGFRDVIGRLQARVEKLEGADSCTTLKFQGQEEDELWSPQPPPNPPPNPEGRTGIWSLLSEGWLWVDAPPVGIEPGGPPWKSKGIHERDQCPFDFSGIDVGDPNKTSLRHAEEPRFHMRPSGAPGNKIERHEIDPSRKADPVVTDLLTPVESTIAMQLSNWLSHHLAQVPAAFGDEFVSQCERTVRGVLVEARIQDQYVTFPETPSIGTLRLRAVGADEPPPFRDLALKPEPCEHAKSGSTPCYMNHGSPAASEDGRCIGCGRMTHEIDRELCMRPTEKEEDPDAN